MSWIYNDKNWPNLTWDATKINELIGNIRYQQGLLRGRLSALGLDLKQETSLNSLTTDIIKTSAIEGEHLNTKEVRSSVAKRLNIKIKDYVKPSDNVTGIVDIMIDATQNYKEPITQKRLFNWHQSLFENNKPLLYDIKIGAFRDDKNGPMQVISGPIGREKVHFQAPKAEVLKTEIEKFINWFENNNSIDLLLKAGVAHFWFITLHPFEDGNGRIARAIADMVLAKSEDSGYRAYSMSNQIEIEREDYYKVLESQQRANVDITKWLVWFLGCLDRAIKSSDVIIENVLYKSAIWDLMSKNSTNTRQRKVINKMLDNFKGNMNTSKYAKIAKCSADTALRDIRTLIEIGVLMKNDTGGRSTSYKLKPKAKT